jgi:mRNA-degrading endonuclease toxin of MazEF toxin-antitoxin module
LPTEVLLEEADGVPYRSAVSLDNVQVVSKRRLSELIVRLTESHLTEVCEALRFAVAC